MDLRNEESQNMKTSNSLDSVDTAIADYLVAPLRTKADLTKQIEPICVDSDNRFTNLPIKYQDIHNAYIIHKEAIWFVEDVDLIHDLKDWAKLTDNERYFIKHILAFFAASDGIVNENLASKFFSETKWSEIRSFYAVQIFMENIHSDMYARLIETYIDDAAEKHNLFNAVTTMPCIKRKADWALTWMNSDTSFATRLVAFAVVEGIFFSGAFCCIHWLNKKGLMPGLSESNIYIARDEGLHTLFAVLLYTRYIEYKLPVETIYEIITDAVVIEKQFINEALSCSLIGMNAGMMSEYIEFCADRLIQQLGYASYYKVKNPFPFMDEIGIASITNFFDRRSTDYKKLVSKTATGSSISMAFDNDF